MGRNIKGINHPDQSYKQYYRPYLNNMGERESGKNQGEDHGQKLSDYQDGAAVITVGHNTTERREQEGGKL